MDRDLPGPRPVGPAEAVEQAHQPPGGRFINGFGLAIYRSAAAYLEQNRAAFIAGLQRRNGRPSAREAPAVAP